MPETQESTPLIGQASTSLSFTSNFPVPSQMVCQGDKVANWEFFQQQWENYEVATGLDRRDPRIRLATLRSVMGKECLQIFMNLKLTEDERKDVNTCVQALAAHFKPKRNVVYERYVFNLCAQNDQETTDEFVNRIRKLASSCEFGALTEELIRDKLVLGIKDQSTKLRLLKEDKLTLDKAINICRSSEIANIQLKSMKTCTPYMESYNERKANKHRPLSEVTSQSRVLRRTTLQPRKVKTTTQNTNAIIVGDRPTTSSKTAQPSARRAGLVAKGITSLQFVYRRKQQTRVMFARWTT